MLRMASDGWGRSSTATQSPSRNASLSSPLRSCVSATLTEAAGCRIPAQIRPRIIGAVGTEDANLDGPLVYIDHSDIRPGKVADLRRTVSALVQFVEQREPRLLSYTFHIDPDALRMTVVAVHPDRASLQLHLQLGGPEFRKVGEFIELRLIEVYGDPGRTVRDLLVEKARMLGHGARVVVRDRTLGFARFPFTNRAGATSNASDAEAEAAV